MFSMERLHPVQEKKHHGCIRCVRVDVETSGTNQRMDRTKRRQPQSIARPERSAQTDAENLLRTATLKIGSQKLVRGPPPMAVRRRHQRLRHGVPHRVTDIDMPGDDSACNDRFKPDSGQWRRFIITGTR